VQAGHPRDSDRLFHLAAPAVDIGQGGIAPQRVIQEVVLVVDLLADAHVIVFRLQRGVVGAFDIVEDLVLFLQREAAQQVGDGVHVARHEIHGPVIEDHRRHRPPHIRPPVRHGALVIDIRAGQQPQHDPFGRPGDLLQRRDHLRTPGFLQAAELVRRNAQHVRQVSGPGQGRVGAVRRQNRLNRDRLQQPVQLVPFDLVGDQDRDQVVDVRATRDVGRQRVLAVEHHAAAASRSRYRRPGLNVVIAIIAKHAIRLAHHNQVDIGHARRQPHNRIEHRRRIRLWLARVDVQRRVHRHMCLDQRVELHRVAGTQQRVVGADIELDLFASRLGYCPVHSMSSAPTQILHWNDAKSDAQQHGHRQGDSNGRNRPKTAATLLA